MGAEMDTEDLLKIAREAARYNDGTQVGQVWQFIALMAGQAREQAPDVEIAGTPDAVLRYGEVMNVVAGEPMEPQQCFANALTAAVLGDGTYIEGYALHTLMPVPHAWVDTDGVCREVTWHEPGSVYIGIRFDTQAVLEHVRRIGYHGVLETDWLNDNEIARHGLEHLLYREPDAYRCGHCEREMDEDFGWCSQTCYALDSNAP